MNYQESLNFIKESFFFADYKEQEALDNLQQLIALEENQRVIIEDLKNFAKEKERYASEIVNLEYRIDNQRTELHKLNDAHSVLTCKYETLNKAMDKACKMLAHFLYDYEDEEDNENPGSNVAYYCYLNKAKSLKEKYMKEVSK